jgi:hypothetical protein
MSKKQTTTTAQSLPSGDSASYITRPKTKPDVTTRGKLNEWRNGYKEFIPVGSKPSNRTMLKQLGGSSFYKSEGEKDSSWSLHLNVDAKDCADPVAALLEQFLFLTEGEQKQKPKLPEGSQGRMLFDNGEGLQIWLDHETGKVSILAQLDCSPNIERLLLQVESQMNVCIARYRQDIINANNK